MSKQAFCVKGLLGGVVWELAEFIMSSSVIVETPTRARYVLAKDAKELASIKHHSNDPVKLRACDRERNSTMMTDEDDTYGEDQVHFENSCDEQR